MDYRVVDSGMVSRLQPAERWNGSRCRDRGFGLNRFGFAA